MRRPGQSGDDASFGRSAGMQPGRGAALLVVAVLLGVVLLNAADDAPPDRAPAGSSDNGTSETTLPAEVSTTTVVTLPPRAPADVKVIAANGTDTKGVARKATDLLKASGYNVLSPTDTTAKAAASNVYFVGDYQREAEAVAAGLSLPVTSVQPFPTAPPPIADARGASVIVVIGSDLASTLGGSTTASTAAGATSTTTAAPGATTSTTKKP